jgi:hypothetical protein
MPLWNRKVNMNETDLARIEQEVGVRLPPAYREFLEAPPASLAKFIASMVEAEGEFSVPAFLTVNPLIGYNVAVRNPDDPRYDDLAFEFDSDPEVRWPPEHFIIGTDGHGNFYSIKHEEETSRVYYWEHYCEFEVHSKSLAAFAKTIPREFS